jgi:sigma-B regulation protein RsbU (phosphoserine phosphatase)
MADILVIDDDPIIQCILQRVLADQGYQVVAVGTAQEGLAQAEKLQPAVVLCDWRLPGSMDGLAICHWLKTHPLLSTTFFLLITGHLETANRVEALEAGADDLLMKPIDMAELRARVKSGVRLHQLTHDLRQQKHLLEGELAEAAAYVQSLLPKGTQAPVKIETRFVPSRQLGGDCFDYYWLDPDSLVMYLLDVSGHGLGAALLSTSVLNVLRSQSLPRTDFHRPETVLTGLNEKFQMDEQHDKYFTIWYGVYNRVTHQLTYASAGHPPAILISPAAVQQLRTPGLPVGMMPTETYVGQHCQVPEDSRLYIFSDGIYESSISATPGLNSFIQQLAQHSQRSSLADLASQLTCRLPSDTPLADDLSLLAVEFG